MVRWVSRPRCSIRPRLCQDRRADGARGRGGEIRWDLCDPHALRGDRILQALDEAIPIGREAHIPVEIWHLKAAGKQNWGRMPKVVARIDSARRAGVDIAADTYAYPAWFNSMSAFVPPWALDGGTAKLLARLRDPAARRRIRQDMLTPSDAWDNEWQEIPGPESVLISVVQNPGPAPYQGKTLAEVAKLRKKDRDRDAARHPDRGSAYTYVAVFGCPSPTSRSR